MVGKMPKLIGIIGIVLMAAMLIFAALIPWLVSTDVMRSAIARELSAFVGRPVALQGKVTLQLFPTPKTILENVTLPIRGEEEQPKLSIERIEADVALLTLLSRNPDFTDFSLYQPKLNLTRSPDGAINWQDGLGRVSSAVVAAKRQIKESADGNPEPLLPDGFPTSLASIQIYNGEIYLNTPQSERIDQLTQINGFVSWPLVDRAASIEIEGVWQEEGITIDVQSEQLIAVLSGLSADTDVLIEHPLGSIEFQGSLGLGDTLFADGTVSFKTGSLTKLLNMIGTNIDAGRALEAVAIDGTMKLGPRKASLVTENLVVDQNIGAGVLELSFAGDKPPSINGTLDFESLNLNAFLAAFISLPDSIDDQRSKVDLDFISQIHTDLRLSAKAAVLGSIEMTGLAATAQISDVGALFDIGDAQAYDGLVQAKLHFTTSEDGTEKSTVSIAGQDVDLGQAKQLLTLPNAVPTGTVTFSLDAEAPLSGWNTMLQTAKGTLAVNITSGATTGFGAQTLMDNVQENAFFSLRTAEDISEPFDLLNLEGNLTDGVMAIENAQIDYPSGKVTLGGVAPYRSGGIALTASVEPATDEDESEAKFFIGGSWARAFATLLNTQIEGAE